MHILVLGAAAGGGFPQWNSNSENCQRSRAGDPLVVPRSQSSLAVSADGQSWYVLNASPDIRQQIWDNPRLHPRQGLRDSAIAGVVLTNGDVDHIAGLLTLREGQHLALYATPRIFSVLKANSIFDVLNPVAVERRPFELDVPFELCDRQGRASGLTVEAFPVPGKVALYLEDAASGENFGTVTEDTVGLRISQPGQGKHFFYIPGCMALPQDLVDRLSGAPLLFFDGTLWRDDEMIQQGVGHKTGKRMGHLSMSGPDGTIALMRDLRIERRIFIHINNTNPVLAADSPEYSETVAAGWKIAHDGMEIEL